MKNEVILVDEKDRKTGVCEKMSAHRRGRLHRAFSVFVFGSAGRLLIQQRAAGKYHSAGLWSNTCCSHPRPGETTRQAAHRRLREEMGFDCSLRKIFAFRYKTDFGNGLFENEYDHVLAGTFDGAPKPCPSEVRDWKWISTAALQSDVRKHPVRYTSWLKKCLRRVLYHNH